MGRSAGVATLEDSRDAQAVRRARDGRRAGLAALAAVVLLGASGLLGVRSSTSTVESPDGWSLQVEHPQVTRAGVAAPLHVTVRRAGGFDGPVTLSVSSALLERFDFQNFYPNPAAETATGADLLYEFDPPPGDTLLLSLDARTAPDQNGSTEVYRVALLVEGRAVAQVRFRMWVVP